MPRSELEVTYDDIGLVYVGGMYDGIRADAPDGSVIVVRSVTNGRGQYSCQWPDSKVAETGEMPTFDAAVHETACMYAKRIQPEA